MRFLAWAPIWIVRSLHCCISYASLTEVIQPIRDISGTTNDILWSMLDLVWLLWVSRLGRGKMAMWRERFTEGIVWNLLSWEVVSMNFKCQRHTWSYTVKVVKMKWLGLELGGESIWSTWDCLSCSFPIQYLPNCSLPVRPVPPINNYYTLTLFQQSSPDGANTPLLR